MAFPTVVTTAVTNGSTAQTEPVVNLPGSLVVGNTIVVVLRKSADTVTTLGMTGWNSILGSSADASDDHLLIAWRKVDGTEGATETFNGGASTKFAATAYQIGDAADPDVNPPEAQTAGISGTSNAPDPAALTPSGGAKDYLWVVVGSWEGEQTSPPTYPANYTASRLDATSGTGGAVATNCQVHTAVRTNNATSENPGTFSISASDDWMATTIAIYPSSGKTLAADAATYTYTATAAGVELGRVVVADSASYLYTASDATLQKGLTLVADAASYAYTATDAALEHDRQIVADAATYTYTATDAGLSRDIPLVADSASYTWTANDAGPEHGRQIVADSAAYTWTAQDAALEYTPTAGAYTIDGDSAAYLWAANDAGLEYTPLAAEEESSGGVWRHYRTPADLRRARERELAELAITELEQRRIDRAAAKIARVVAKEGLNATVPAVVAQPAFDALLMVLQPSEGMIQALAQAIVERIIWAQAMQQADEESALMALLAEL